MSGLATVLRSRGEAVAAGGVLLLAVALGCSSDESSGMDAGGPGTADRAPATGGASSGGLDGSTASGGFGGDLGGLPEEEKDLSAFRAPVVTGEHLWFVNPESSRVALITATSLEVEILSGGFRPTYVAAVPAGADVDSALVINAGSQDATWYRLAAGAITTRTFPVHRGANRWAVSASGRWAVAYSVAEPDVALDPTDGLQDITVADLRSDPPDTHRLTVGYRPSAVSFSAGEEELIVVAQPGISVIDLLGAQPEASRWLDLGSTTGRGVVVTPSGEYALVRRSSQEGVQIVPLDGAPPAQIMLDGPATDITLSADGQRAVAVVRQQRQLAVFDVDGAYADPDDFDLVHVPGELFGSAALSPDGETAALYTTAVDNSRIIVVDLRAGTDYLDLRTVDVKAPVKSVQATPDGEHAIVLMDRAANSTNPGSFALISLRTARFPRIEATTAAVHQVAVSSESALVTTRDSQLGVFESYMIRMPAGSIDRVSLSSPPTAVGVLSEQGLGYVSQSHPEGRVSIMNFGTGQVRTLTGFELASKVVE